MMIDAREASVNSPSESPHKDTCLISLEMHFSFPLFSHLKTLCTRPMLPLLK